MTVRLDQPMARLIVYLCLVGLVMGAVYFTRRIQLSAAGLKAPLSSSGGADALRKARLLCQRLTPGEPTTLVVFHNVLASSEGEPGQKPRPLRDEWVVQSDDGNPNAAFIVAYDVRTGALRRLSWSSPRYTQAPRVTEAPTPGQPRLDIARATAMTRYILHRLSVPAADGPWCFVPSRPEMVGKFQRINLVSRQWSVRTVIDPANAELICIHLLAAPDPRWRHVQ
jgi:hypothetical protein